MLLFVLFATHPILHSLAVHVIGRIAKLVVHECTLSEM